MLQVFFFKEKIFIITNLVCREIKQKKSLIHNEQRKNDFSLFKFKNFCNILFYKNTLKCIQ